MESKEEQMNNEYFSSEIDRSEYVTECWNCGRFKTSEHFTEFDEECKTNSNARQSCNECRGKDGKD
jgi:hypothetical protein